MDLKNLSNADKIKLGAAALGIVIALGLVYWFGIRSNDPIKQFENHQADAGTPADVPATPRNRVVPESGGQ
jgi:hypothetical protein